FRERWLGMSPQERQEYLEREFPQSDDRNGDRQLGRDRDMTERQPRGFDNGRGAMRPPNNQPIQRPVQPPAQRPAPGR
ncbi:MAG: hypothetical protein HW386_400, partial [Gammaproteobacteria bacterium]|nr:hypothetical protein [Gammaproteobacteria bacterium]